MLGPYSGADEINSAIRRRLKFQECMDFVGKSGDYLMSGDSHAILAR